MKLRRLMRNRPSMTLHEPQVPLPKIADLSVGRGDLVGVDFFLTGCEASTCGVFATVCVYSSSATVKTAFCSLVRNDKRPGCVNDFRAL